MTSKQSATITLQQGIIAALLQITLEISKQYNDVCAKNKRLAKSLHKEIDYSERLENKIKKLKAKEEKI